jgi:hypothetical protein
MSGTKAPESEWLDGVLLNQIEKLLDLAESLRREAQKVDPESRLAGK